MKTESAGPKPCEGAKRRRIEHLRRKSAWAEAQTTCVPFRSLLLVIGAVWKTWKQDLVQFFYTQFCLLHLSTYNFMYFCRRNVRTYCHFFLFHIRTDCTWYFSCMVSMLLHVFILQPFCSTGLLLPKLTLTVSLLLFPTTFDDRPDDINFSILSFSLSATVTASALQGISFAIFLANVLVSKQETDRASFFT